MVLELRIFTFAPLLFGVPLVFKSLGLMLPCVIFPSMPGTFRVFFSSAGFLAVTYWSMRPWRVMLGPPLVLTTGPLFLLIGGFLSDY